ncbi:MAG TPA: hypothetical protein VMV18_12740 [bacterium]|nr:hypothetical protein [bacterium]
MNALRPSTEEPAIGQLLGIAKRRLAPALLAFAIPFAAALTVALSLPPVYRASALVVVEHTGSDPAADDVEARIHLLEERNFSRARLASLMSEMDLYPRLRAVSPEAAIDRFRGDLHVEPKVVERGWGHATATLETTCRGSDPGEAARVADSLARFYVEEDRSLRVERARRNVESLQLQLTAVGKRLSGAKPSPEPALDDLAAARAAGVDPVAIASLEKRLRANSAEITAITGKRPPPPEPEVVATPEPPSPLAEERARLQGELSDLQSKYTDQHPDVIRVKAELERLPAVPTKSPVARTPPHAAPAVPVAPALRALLVERENLRAEAARLRPAPGASSSPVAADVKATETQYATLLTRYDEALAEQTLAAGPDRDAFRVLDAAVVPAAPVGPDRMRIVFLGAVVSLFAALGIVVAFEQLDTSFHTPEELASFTKVRVLASVPHIPQAGDRGRRVRRVLLAAALTSASLAAVTTVSWKFAADNHALAARIVKGRSQP